MLVNSSTDTFYIDISVIIPTYNRSLLIRETIDSVLEQTFTNWELIIVDDGSTDNTIELINSIQDPRIRVLSVPHCGNIAMLRNIGVQNSSGNWISFLDSDDIWVPQKLQIQLNALQKNANKWSYGGFELMNETSITIPTKYGSYHSFSGWIVRKIITYEATANISSVMLARKLFDEVGGFNVDPKLFCREDYEFVLRLALYAEAIAIDAVLARIRDHKNRTTNTIINGPESTANVYKYFYKICDDKDLKQLVKQQYARHLAEAAEKNLSKKKYLRAIKYFAKAIIKGDKLRHLLSSFKHGFSNH
jgi:glycosyltransferase involved in cell wall biosynthesis